LRCKEQALATYNKGTQGGEESIDFPLPDGSSHTKKNAGYSSSGKDISTGQLATEPIAERKAYFTYLEGRGFALNWQGEPCYGTSPI